MIPTKHSQHLYTLDRHFSESSLGTVGTMATLDTANLASGVAKKHPDLPAIITTRIISDTISSYKDLLDAAKKYREALLHVSEAAADFGEALEGAARCKGAGSSAEPLQSAGGLHYLVSNHQQILAKTIQRSFEQPVRKQVIQLKKVTDQNEKEFRNVLKTKTKALRAQEADNIKLSKQRVRNLAAYRSSLLELTSQIDDIDKLKYQHFAQQFDLAQTTSHNILSFASAVVRAEVEIYEGIAKKGWSGGGLDELISTGIDPFGLSDDEDEEHEVDLYPSPKQGFFASVSQFGINGNLNSNNNTNTNSFFNNDTVKTKKEFDVTQKISSAFQHVASFANLTDKGKREGQDKKETDNETKTDTSLDTSKNNSSDTSHLGYSPSLPIDSTSNYNALPISSTSHESSPPPLNYLKSYINGSGVEESSNFANSANTSNLESPSLFTNPFAWPTSGADTSSSTQNQVSNIGPEIRGSQTQFNSHSDSVFGSSNSSGLNASNNTSTKNDNNINRNNSIYSIHNTTNNYSSFGKTVLPVKPGHLKQSNGKGLFSTLPQTSILPKSDESERRKLSGVDFGRTVSLTSIGNDSIDYYYSYNEDAEERNGDGDVDEEDREEGEGDVSVVHDSANDRYSNLQSSTSIPSINKESDSNQFRKGDLDDMMLEYSGWKNVKSASSTSLSTTPTY